MTAPTPVWTALDQSDRSLSIGAIAISPFESDAAHTKITSATLPPANLNDLVKNLVVYAGIGRFSSGGFLNGTAFSDGGPRRGILKSTDGGAAWNPIGVKAFSGLDIGRIIPSQTDSNTFLLTATSSTARPNSDHAGVYLITDGGTKDGVYQPVLKGEVSDLVADPGNPMRFYAAIPYSGVYVSQDGGKTWTIINGPVAMGPANTLNAATINGVDYDRDPGNLSADPQITEGLANAGTIRLAVSGQTVGGGTANNTVWAGLVSNITNRAMAIFSRATKEPPGRKLPIFQPPTAPPTSMLRATPTLRWLATQVAPCACTSAEPSTGRPTLCAISAMDTSAGTKRAPASGTNPVDRPSDLSARGQPRHDLRQIRAF